eukprot:m.119153 g.119153  ORF g.119153 m.119153 type:complete len:2856 (-) comp12904_c0_seq2:216-8783(-)
MMMLVFVFVAFVALLLTSTFSGVHSQKPAGCECSTPCRFDETSQTCISCPGCVGQLEIKLDCDNSSVFDLWRGLSWHALVLNKTVDDEERIGELASNVFARARFYYAIDIQLQASAASVESSRFSLYPVSSLRYLVNTTVPAVKESLSLFLADAVGESTTLEEYTQAVNVYFLSWLSVLNHVLDPTENLLREFEMNLQISNALVSNSIPTTLIPISSTCGVGRNLSERVLLKEKIMVRICDTVVNLTTLDVPLLTRPLFVLLEQVIPTLQAQTAILFYNNVVLFHVLEIRSTTLQTRLTQIADLTVSSLFTSQSHIEATHLTLSALPRTLNSTTNMLEHWVSDPSGSLTLLRKHRDNISRLNEMATYRAVSSEIHAQQLADTMKVLFSFFLDTFDMPLNLSLASRSSIVTLAKLHGVGQPPFLQSKVESVKGFYSLLDLDETLHQTSVFLTDVSSFLGAVGDYDASISRLNTRLQTPLMSALDSSNFSPIPLSSVNGSLSNMVSAFTSILAAINTHIPNSLVVRESSDLGILLNLLEERSASASIHADVGLAVVSAYEARIFQLKEEGNTTKLLRRLNDTKNVANDVLLNFLSTDDKVASTSSILDSVDARLAQLALASSKQQLSRSPVIRPSFFGNAFLSSQLHLNATLSDHHVQYKMVASGLDVTTTEVGANNSNTTLLVELQTSGTFSPLPLHGDATFHSVRFPFSQKGVLLSPDVASSIRAWRLSPSKDADSLFFSNTRVNVAIQALDKSLLPARGPVRVSFFVTDSIKLDFPLNSSQYSLLLQSSCETNVSLFNTCIASVSTQSDWFGLNTPYNTLYFFATSNATISSSSSLQPFHKVVVHGRNYSKVATGSFNIEDAILPQPQLLLEFPIHTLTEGEVFEAKIQNLWDSAIASFIVRISLPRHILLLSTMPNNAFNVDVLNETINERGVLVISGIRKNSASKGITLNNSSYIATVKLKYVSSPSVIPLETSKTLHMSVEEITYITGRTLRDVPKAGLITTAAGIKLSPHHISLVSAGAVILLPKVASTHLVDIQPLSPSPPRTFVDLVGFNGLGMHVTIDPASVSCSVPVSSGFVFLDGEETSMGSACSMVVCENSRLAAQSPTSLTFSTNDGRGSIAKVATPSILVQYVMELEVLSSRKCISAIRSETCTDFSISQSVELGVSATINNRQTLDLTEQAKLFESFVSDRNNILDIEGNVARLNTNALVSTMPNPNSVVISIQNNSHNNSNNNGFSDVLVTALKLNINPEVLATQLYVEGINPEDLSISVSDDLKSNDVGEANLNDGVFVAGRTNTVTFTFSYFNSPTFREGGASLAVVVGRVRLSNGHVEDINGADLKLINCSEQECGFAFNGSILTRSTAGVGMHALVFQWSPSVVCANGPSSSVFEMTAVLNVSVVSLEGSLTNIDDVAFIGVVGDAAVSAGVRGKYTPKPVLEYTTFVPNRKIEVDLTSLLASINIQALSGGLSVVSVSESNVVEVYASSVGKKFLSISYYGISREVEVDAVSYAGFEAFYVPYPHRFLNTAESLRDIDLLKSLRLDDPHFCQLPNTTSSFDHVQGEVVVLLTLSNGTQLLITPSDIADDVIVSEFSSGLSILSLGPSNNSDNSGNEFPYRYVVQPVEAGTSFVGIIFWGNAVGIRSRISNSLANVVDLSCDLVGSARIQCSINFVCAGSGTSSSYFFGGASVQTSKHTHQRQEEGIAISLSQYVDFSVESDIFAEAIVVNKTTGDIVTLENTPYLLKVVATSVHSPDLKEIIQYGGNLDAGVLDVDLGEDGDVPIDPVGTGDIFNVPVRVNTGGKVLGAFDISIMFNTSVLRLFGYDESDIPLILEVHTPSPTENDKGLGEKLGEVRVVGVSLSIEPILLNLVFGAVDGLGSAIVTDLSVYIHTLAFADFSKVVENEPSIASSRVPLLIEATSPSRRRRWPRNPQQFPSTTKSGDFNFTSNVKPIFGRNSSPPPIKVVGKRRQRLVNSSQNHRRRQERAMGVIDCTFFDFYVLGSCPDPVSCIEVIPGDVNSDCLVDSVDAALVLVLLQQRAVNFQTRLGTRLLRLMGAFDLEARADVDVSGVVTTTDARLLVAVLAGNNALVTFDGKVDVPSRETSKLSLKVMVETPTASDVELAFFAVITAPCSELLEINLTPFSTLSKQLVVTEGEFEGATGVAVQPVYSIVIQIPLNPEEEGVYSLVIEDPTFFALSRVGVSFFQISSSGNDFFFNDERTLQYTTRFSVRISPFPSLGLFALFVDGHTPLVDNVQLSITSVLGDFPNDVPNFTRWASGFVTRADTVLASINVGGSKQCAVSDCANACVNIGGDCVGFLLSVDVNSEGLCILMKEVIDASSRMNRRNVAYIRSALVVPEPSMVPDNFDLIFVGNSTTPGMELRMLRFSTAMTPKSILSELYGVDLAICGESCNRYGFACLGFYFFGGSRCNLLSSIGSSTGIATNIPSYSFAKQISISEVLPSGYELVFVGDTPFVLLGEEPMRFKTAFDESALLGRLATSVSGCAFECSRLLFCRGFAFLLQSSTCRLLSDIGSSSNGVVRGTLTSSSLLSFSRETSPPAMDAAVVGYTLFSSNTPLTAGMRFSAAFSSDNILLMEEVSSVSQCALLCEAMESGVCLGFFVYVPKNYAATSLLQCRILSSLGVLVATSTHSYSFIRDASKNSASSVPDYNIDISSGMGMRFATAFDPAHQLEKTKVITLVECSFRCNEHPSCVGFFAYNLPSGEYHRCITLDSVSGTSETSLDGYSLSLKTPVERLGFFPAFANGGSTRFSSAFDRNAFLQPTQTLVDAFSFDDASFACGLECVDFGEKCLGFFVFLSRAGDEFKCNVLASVGIDGGVSTTLQSRSYMRQP